MHFMHETEAQVWASFLRRGIRLSGADELSRTTGAPGIWIGNQFRCLPDFRYNAGRDSLWIEVKSIVSLVESPWIGRGLYFTLKDRHLRDYRVVAKHTNTPVRIICIVQDRSEVRVIDLASHMHQRMGMHTAGFHWTSMPLIGTRADLERDYDHVRSWPGADELVDWTIYGTAREWVSRATFARQMRIFRAFSDMARRVGKEPSPSMDPRNFKDRYA